MHTVRLFVLLCLAAPVLVPSPSGSQVLGIMGYSLVITVQLLGANPPVSVGSITWQAGGSLLAPGGRVALTYSSTSVTLNISALSSGDDGTNYTLMVSHPTGTRNHSFQLLIKGNRTVAFHPIPMLHLIPFPCCISSHSHAASHPIPMLHLIPFPCCISFHSHVPSPLSLFPPL